MAIIVLTAILVSGCKKETNEEELNWPEPYVPEWLGPFMGVYSGTYNGDDDGNWTFHIDGYTAYYIEFVSSADSSKSYYMADLTESGSFSNYGGGNYLVSGNITDTGQVSGSWQNHWNNTQGEFLGSKTQ